MDQLMAGMQVKSTGSKEQKRQRRRIREHETYTRAKSLLPTPDVIYPSGHPSSTKVTDFLETAVNHRCVFWDGHVTTGTRLE
jgi:hypothetical protein